MESTPTAGVAGPLALAAASFPLLVYDHGEQLDNSQTILSVADGSSRTYRLPELRHHRCLETPRGLVLMVETASSQCSLWNPQTGEKIALPAMGKAPPDACRCVLSDATSSPDCLVLVYDLVQPELLFCRVGGGAWISQSYDNGLYKLPETESHLATTEMEICCVAGVEGKFYFLQSPCLLGALSFAPDPEPHLEFTTMEALQPTIDSGAAQVVTMTYLLESSQELYLVCIFFLGCDFERVEEVGAYRMDFAKRQWCKVTDDIGDRAFLLGPHSFAASCPASEHGLKRGCVYFAFDIFGETNDFQVFDLLRGTREVTGPGEDVPLPMREPFWMVPVLP